MENEEDEQSEMRSQSQEHFALNRSRAVMGWLLANVTRGTRRSHFRRALSKDTPE
jgi:hypothetical protein